MNFGGMWGCICLSYLYLFSYLPPGFLGGRIARNICQAVIFMLYTFCLSLYFALMCSSVSILDMLLQSQMHCCKLNRSKALQLKTSINLAKLLLTLRCSFAPNPTIIASCLLNAPLLSHDHHLNSSLFSLVGSLQDPIFPYISDLFNDVTGAKVSGNCFMGLLCCCNLSNDFFPNSIICGYRTNF